MKLLEKIALTIFSIFILIFSLLLCLVLFGWIEASNVYFVLQHMIANPTFHHVSLGISIIFILLAVKCVFFPSFAKEKTERSEGILLENECGKLLISIDTIENLVKGVVIGFPNITASNCRVKLDKQINNVVIDMNLVVKPDTVIKELSNNLQEKVKEIIKTTTEIDVKEVNIKVKNIEAPKDEH